MSETYQPSRPRLSTLIAVLLVHVLVVLGLVRALAPDFSARAVSAVVETFSVTVTAPPPPPPPKPPAKAREIKAAGASGEAGKKAIPRAVAAPKPRIALAKTPAPRAASSGNADSSGAKDSGSGPGGGGAGNGPGSGNGGNGQGGGHVQKAEKIAGDINSARDYPRETRDLRIGTSVVVAISVSAEGAPTGCRVVRPARDAEAGPLTCRLALERFRFRPATDGAGNPVASIYGWEQRWFY